MLVERLYSLGEWAKANPIKTTAVVATTVTGLVVLLVPDAQHALVGVVDFLQRVGPERTQRFQDCMSRQAQKELYDGVAASNCGYNNL